jgi:hypothetical protein
MADDAMDIEQRTRARAYLLWEAEGSPPDRDNEYWQRARERIEAEGESSYPPTQSRGFRT